MLTDTDYLNPTRHFWHRCTKCAEASTTKVGGDVELKEYIKVNEEKICEGCDPIRFHNLKYGAPLKIQKPSQEIKTNEQK